MKIYILAGEASGDLHGSNLVKQINSLNNNVQFRGFGGDLMQKEGVQLSKHIKELAFMGFKEVITNLPTIIGNIKYCKKDIKTFNPDIVIFIDYPGFNLRICKWAKLNRYKTVYYISPQLWAWKEGRVELIRKYVDKMIVILPFEKNFYLKHKIEVDYVGHPLLDVLSKMSSNENWLEKNGFQSDKIIALLPGSRKQEIKKMLPIMLSVADSFPEYTFVLAMAPNLSRMEYKELLAPYPQVIAIQGDTYQILLHSQLAMVTSGTATLETALLNCPQVVCYKGSKLSFWIAKMIVNIRYISLVNLILEKPVVKELIQEELTKETLIEELKKLINPIHRKQILMDYSILGKLLGNEGASFRAAKIILSL